MAKLSDHIDKHIGICWAIRRYSKANSSSAVHKGTLINDLTEHMVRVVEELGYYTGDAKYPMAHPTLSPQYAFEECDLWDITTEYGRRRRQVLDKLQEYIDNAE